MSRFLPLALSLAFVLPGCTWVKMEPQGAEVRVVMTRGGSEFSQLTDAYFARSSVKPMGVMLLVDSRHPGLDSDLEAWEWLKNQPCDRAVVGTKADKLTRAERARHTKQLESSFERPVLLVSAATGEGLEELWKLIVRLTSRTVP